MADIHSEHQLSPSSWNRFEECPRKYWLSTYATGSLLKDPRKIMFRKVCFPVGLDKQHYASSGRGRVIGTTFHKGEWSWKVELDDGSIDYHVRE